MSSDASQQQSSMNPADAEQARRQQVSQIAEEIAQLSEQDLQPMQYYSEFLQRIYFVVQAFAAAVWIRTPQGNLVIQCQINLRELNLDRTPETRPMHDELLRQSALQAKGGLIRPNFSHNFGATPDQIAGNPTDYEIILVPILQDKKVIGLLEVWQDPNRPNVVSKALFDFMVRMSSFVSLFNRNHQLRQMLGQQELWLKLETFARQIHNSLVVTECSYLIANEGRRLIEADRISVATRPNKKSSVTAISGADVVEKRSNLVVLMRKLFDAVIDWGEKLVYTGTKDDALPPKVLSALDNYLAESNAKVLVIMPLQDEREKELKKKARSALLMECFETNLQPDQLMARMDVVGRHAAPALYNALEYKRIPMRFLWLPLAYVQDGLGGKAKAITTAVAAGLTLLILALIFLPFPLKMEATGNCLPKDRVYIFSPLQGVVQEIAPGLQSGSRVTKGQTLLTMYDSDLMKQVSELQGEIAGLEAKVKMAGKPSDPNDNKGEAIVAAATDKITMIKKTELLLNLRKRTNANLSKPGEFSVTAPRTGIILTADPRELHGKAVKPSDKLMQIGFTDLVNPKLADWEVELKIPQKHVGQVFHAFETHPNAELDVDLLFSARAESGIYRAKLSRKHIAAQTTNQKDDNNEPEAIVYAWARIHPIKDVNGKDDIPLDRQVPARLLTSGTEVRTRIRCGYYPAGYSLFYGVYEFFYEKVLFPLSWR
jgi:hypothetical protein